MEKDIKDSYSTDPENREQDVHEAPLDAVPKSRWERSWPVIAAGAGLFSDGYLNGVRDNVLPAIVSSTDVIDAAGDWFSQYDAQENLQEAIHLFPRAEQRLFHRIRRNCRGPARIWLP